MDGGYNISDDESGADQLCGFTGVEPTAKLLAMASLRISTLMVGEQRRTDPDYRAGFPSPAIDAIPIGLCPLTDQRGFTRADPGDNGNPSPACDIGAFEASPIIVNTLADNVISGDGLCTLREAIDNVNSGSDTTDGDCASDRKLIIFSVSGTITPLTPLPNIAAASGAIIDGRNQNITIDGGGAQQVFAVNSGGTLNLKNLTVADGSATNGGGISNAGTLSVSNVTFSSNSATAQGGAIFNSGPTLDITNSTFSNNTQTPGFDPHDGGAAVYTNAGTTTVTGSTFNGNTATSNSGAIYPDGTAVLNVTNSTFSGNGAATASGGAILSFSSGAVTLTNCTLSGNINGGTIRNFSTGSFTVKSSIIAGGGGNDCTGTITNVGGFPNIADDASCGFPTVNSATGQVLGDNVDPLLDPAGLQDNGGPTHTIALQSISPAIDAVSIAELPGHRSAWHCSSRSRRYQQYPSCVRRRRV